MKNFSELIYRLLVRYGWTLKDILKLKIYEINKLMEYLK